MNTEKQYKETIKKMGREPLNPIGTCFDSSIYQLFDPKIILPKDTILVHGIGISNMPRDKNKIIGHAWLEFKDKEKGWVAVDTTWGLATFRDHYRKGLKLKYLITYTKEEALKAWVKSPPWDEKIKAVMPNKGNK